MMLRMLCVSCLAMLGVMFCASRAVAEENIDGKFVGVENGMIVILNKDGEEEVLAVASTVKITRDKKPAKLGDLREGDSVRIKTEERSGRIVAVMIAAFSAE